MKLLSGILATGVALGTLAVASQANAADIYAPGPVGYKDVAPIVPLWTGFYMGANAGAAWGNLSTNQTDWFWGAAAPNFTAFGGDKLNGNGALGGAQFGYNWQSGGFVLGAEVDLGGMGLNGDHHWVLPVAAGGVLGAVANAKTEGGFYGDVTGRAGWAFGNALLYAKGGFAWLDANREVSASWVNGGVVNSVAWSHNATLTGWTIGGGLEYAVAPNWTIKAEYMYFDFNNANAAWNGNLGGIANNWDLLGKNLEVNTVKLGFNYRFNNWYAPLK